MQLQCLRLVDAARGTDAELERIFDQTAGDVERTIRDEIPFSIDGREVAKRHLESAIGQAVHLVYLPKQKTALLAQAT